VERVLVTNPIVNIFTMQGCYKTYARHVKGDKVDRVSVVCEEGVSAR
jgi:hypothetical protein